MALHKVSRNEVAEREAYERVETAVYRAIDTLNEMLAPTQRLARSRNTVLVESDGSVDSMALVNLIVFIEDELAQALGEQLDLTGADAFAPEDLASVGTVIGALCAKLDR